MAISRLPEVTAAAGHGHSLCRNSGRVASPDLSLAWLWQLGAIPRIRQGGAAAAADTASELASHD